MSLDYGIWRVDRWTESQGGGNNTKGRNEKLGSRLGRRDGVKVWESRKECKVEIGLLRGEPKTTSGSQMLEWVGGGVEGHTDRSLEAQNEEGNGWLGKQLRRVEGRFEMTPGGECWAWRRLCPRPCPTPRPCKGSRSFSLQAEGALMLEETLTGSGITSCYLRLGWQVGG